MISAGLLLLCLGMVWGLVSYGSRYLRLSQGRLDLQNQTLRALAFMSRELSETDPDTVKATNTTTMQGVSFASPRDPHSGTLEYDSHGRLKWSKFVVYYVGDPDGEGNRRLLRKVKTFATVLYPPPPDDVPTMISTASQTQTLANFVSDFVVVPGSPINVTLECSLLDSPLHKDTGMSVHSGVYPRN